MPNSTRENRHTAMLAAVNFAGSLHYTDGAQANDYASELITTLQRGGWHLVHGDDLPAGYAPGDILRHITEPAAILGETPDELRRRLPTTERLSFGAGFTPQEDQAPLPETPQQPAQDADSPGPDPFTRDQERDSRIRALERQLASISQTVGRLEDNTFGSGDRLTSLEERTDDHDERIDNLTAQVGEHFGRIHTLQEAIATLQLITTSHRTELNYLGAETPTLEAPDDPDQRLGGHDNPNPNDDDTNDANVLGDR